MSEATESPTTPESPLDAAAAREVLMDLIQTIEATGGVWATADGLYRPIGDPDWIDIGSVYIRACRILQHEPRFELTEPEHNGS